MDNLLIKKAVAELCGNKSFSRFIAEQSNGECEFITRRFQEILKKLGIESKRINGTLIYPIAILSSEGMICQDVSHWWIEVDGHIIECSKGTIFDVQTNTNLIKYMNLDSINPDPTFHYVQ